MKEKRTGRFQFWDFSTGVRLSFKRLLRKGVFRTTGFTVLGLLMIVVLFWPKDVGDLLTTSASNDVLEVREFERTMPSRNPLMLLSYRNTSFGFTPKVEKWDYQRSNWVRARDRMRGETTIKVLLVTGSHPGPCDRAIDTHMLLKSAKNKIHYSRTHGMHLHYSLMEPHAELTGSWTKLPVLRMLMVSHPEVEWFWWMDSDTVITDINWELPLEKYSGHNLVLLGDDHVFENFTDWNGLLTSNFLIRNSEWSLNLFDAWGSMGEDSTREENGRFLSDALEGRPSGMDADDQSALVYLLTHEKHLWRSEVYLENDFIFTSLWGDVTDKLEEMEAYPSGDPRLPFATHFAGCSRCGGKAGELPWDECQTGMQRAMDFADNQVYERFGYKLRNLTTPPELVPIPGFLIEDVVPSTDERPLGMFMGYPIHKLPGPRVTNWDEQRLSWFRRNPTVKRVNENKQPKTMIVTGSSCSECSNQAGEEFLLQALKNKADYAHFNDMELFYGMADFDSNLTYWWTKIPTIRMLMLTHPDVEFFWWCDADAVITDMAFNFPFEKYKDKNMILYGDIDLIEKRDWIGINAGVYLIRNCQWTLDFFDSWAALGVKNVVEETGKLMSAELEGRPEDTSADDQSALILMLLTDREKKWTPKIALEKHFTISGYWKNIVHRFEEMVEKSSPGLGTMDWPWVTHFAGCQPCGTSMGNFNLDECHIQMRRAFDFADNQILKHYGFEHSPLGTPAVQGKSITM